MNKFLVCVLVSQGIAEKHFWVKPVISIVLMALISKLPVVPMVPGNLILHARETLEKPKMGVMVVLELMEEHEIGPLKQFWALNQLTKLDPKTLEIDG